MWERRRFIIRQTMWCSEIYSIIEGEQNCHKICKLKIWWGIYTQCTNGLNLIDQKLRAAQRTRKMMKYEIYICSFQSSSNQTALVHIRHKHHIVCSLMEIKRREEEKYFRSESIDCKSLSCSIVQCRRALCTLSWIKLYTRLLCCACALTTRKHPNLYVHNLHTQIEFERGSPEKFTPKISINFPSSVLLVSPHRN